MALKCPIRHDHTEMVWQDRWAEWPTPFLGNLDVELMRHLKLQPDTLTRAGRGREAAAKIAHSPGSTDTRAGA